jgi:hypothetical protein
VDTTENLSVRFDAVAYDTAIAVWTNRRQGVDGALEAIKDVALSVHHDFKRLVIIVLANFACRHTQFVRARGGQWWCLIWRSTGESVLAGSLVVLSFTSRFSEVSSDAISVRTA